MPGSQDLIAVVGMAHRMPGEFDGGDFVAACFGMTAGEADEMDPRQRLLLEVGWHALRDAGLGSYRRTASSCGLYIAAPGPLEAASVSDRLALRGPTEVVDASSLAALDRASRAVLSGECELALCGGLDDGASAVVLKRHASAQRDGDRVHAIVHASTPRTVGYVETDGITRLIRGVACLKSARSRWTEEAGVDTHPADGTGIAPIVTVSAKSPASLDELRASTERFLDRNDGRSVAMSANLDREHYPHRWARVMCKPRGWSPKRAAGVDAPREVAFMFPGHGSQYPLMGRSLYAAEPVFRDAVDRCAAVADDLLDIPLRSVLFDERISPEVIDQTAYAQPALFTISYALSCLWQTWGIRPGAVVGHSVGEFAAACVSGALPMHHALTMVADRGRRTQALPAAGAMRAVFAPAEVLEDWLPRRGLDVAAINTPTQTVISGPAAAVEAATAELAERGTPSAPIRVTQAFHSSLVEPMLPGFAATAGAARPLDSRCPFFSTVTGRPHRGRDLDADYWCRNSRAPVRFCQAVQAMYDAGYRVFLEVGPRATLTAFAKECLHYYPPSLILSSSGRPPRTGATDSRETLDLAKAVATLYVQGVDVDWDALHAGRRGMQPVPALEGTGGPL